MREEHGSLVSLPSPERRLHSPEEELCFRLQLELDVEHERQVLYKVALVLEALGILVLLRQWLLM